MDQETQRLVSTSVSGRLPTPPLEPRVQTMAAEPAEVLGRHKNTGQKDYKGAR